MEIRVSGPNIILSPPLVLASGDVAPYVDISDIVMMPSVTDIAGLNRLSRVILHQAGRAIAAMAADAVLDVIDDKPAIGLSMFGVTTPCVTAIAEILRARYDPNTLGREELVAWGQSRALTRAQFEKMQAEAEENPDA